MAGNIYEWCLTDYETGENELTKAEKSCVLRGGSWVLNVEDGFSCFYRGRNAPNRRGSKIGFRLACL
jgi:formylglycine-generating enzyme required for sulfatase activity